MYRPQDNSAGAEQQYHLSAASASPSSNQAQFTPPVCGIDPRLHITPANIPSVARTGPTQPPSTDARNQVPHPDTSPRMIASKIARGSRIGSRPIDRSLPSRTVTADTITDAFVAFILYCNPKFPLDVDTSTLRTTFQSPPKSDNKDFETFRLFELIQKFDAKEIKTWAQLALDLGVEAPDTTKGQSVQKVQQYSVRLKRWMRAMHIDAFFEFLLGKQHPYFLDVPPLDDPYPPSGRDGVLAEEDLAIRALDPSFRPKRGRRRNSDTEPDDRIESGSASKLPRAIEGAPQSAIPLSTVALSAHPDGFNDPWASASAIAPNEIAPWLRRSPGVPQSASGPSHSNSLRWQLDGHDPTPTSAYPLSALPDSMSGHMDVDFDREPRSAITPSTRKRRKHGPAVSSAWPSTNTPGTKPRGRPPANRNIQDGPFGTFPADPANEKASVRTQAMVSDKSSSQDPVAAPVEVPMFRSQGEGTGRPGRLSLQVPPRAGAPVRLATPPRVLVNGETNERGKQSHQTVEDPEPCPVIPHPAPGAGGSYRTVGDLQFYMPDRTIPGFAFEVLRRVLASDLLRADLVGRRRRLTGDEAKRLADAVLDRLGVPRADTDNSRDDIARLTAASWLGVGDQLNVPLGPAVGRGKRITVTRFRTNADGYEEIAPDPRSGDDGPGGGGGGGGGGGRGSSNSNPESDNVREVFDIVWSVGLGSCLGQFEMKSLTLDDDGAGAGAATVPGEDMHDLLLRKGLDAVRHIDRDGWVEQSMHEIARAVPGSRPRPGDENIDWKARCKALEFTARIAKGEFERFRQRVLDQVLDSII